MSAASAGALSYVCVSCGAGMHERACRLRCPRCGYFEDCENGLTPPPRTRSPRAAAGRQESARQRAAQEEA